MTAGPGSSAVRFVAAAVLLAVAATALAQTDVELSRARAKRPRPLIRIVNSREGKPILSARALAPGEATSNEVSIRNGGRLTAAVFLESSHSDGATSGRVGLWDELELTIEDLGSSRRRAIYSGPLAGLGKRAVGRLRPGAARRYRFTAALGNEAGNAYQGASVEVGFHWSARRAFPAPSLRLVLTRRKGRIAAVTIRLRCRTRCKASAALLRARTRIASRTARRRVAGRSMIRFVLAGRRSALGRQSGKPLVVRVRVTDSAGGSARLVRRVR